MEPRSRGAGNRASAPNRPEASSVGDPVRNGPFDLNAYALAKHQQETAQSKSAKPLVHSRRIKSLKIKILDG